jgi:hypothetical protein
MNNMINKIVLWTILIAPWFSLFFLKKDDIKRFMPVSIFSSFLMLLYNVIAYNQKHWIVKVTIVPWFKHFFMPGILGAFLIITLWIFYYTYRKFWVYLITNLILDFMFAIFPIHYLFQDKLKIYQLINITPWGRFVLFVSLSIIIYGYHRWQETIYNKNI